MEGLTIHGYPLNHSKAVRGVIEDMRKTAADPSFVLDMDVYAEEYWREQNWVCHACAGGSAVIHGLGGVRDEDKWSKGETYVAHFYNALRMGWLGSCEFYGYPFPASVDAAYSDSMRDQSDPDFFPAWEAFADALEAHENSVAAALNGEGEQ